MELEWVACASPHEFINNLSVGRLLPHGMQLGKSGLNQIQPKVSSFSPQWNSSKPSVPIRGPRQLGTIRDGADGLSRCSSADPEGMKAVEQGPVPCLLLKRVN